MYLYYIYHIGDSSLNMLLWIHCIHFIYFVDSKKIASFENLLQFKGFWTSNIDKHFSVCSKQFMRYNPSDNVSQKGTEKLTHVNVY